jgi:HSP20 family protein
MPEVARIFLERRSDPDGGDVVRRLVELLNDAGAGPQGECVPPVDVIEHADRVEIIVDVPGIAAGAIRVMYARGTLVIAGRKLPRASNQSGVTFHLAERSFGRFVRTVGLAGAFDVARATASVTAGELRVALPRIEERRGRDISIEVTGPHENPVRR